MHDSLNPMPTDPLGFLAADDEHLAILERHGVVMGPRTPAHHPRLRTAVQPGVQRAEPVQTPRPDSFGK